MAAQVLNVRLGTQDTTPALAHRLRPAIIDMEVTQQVLPEIEVSAWHDLLQGVMEDIMQRLSCDEIWTCRSLSGRWAAAARATGRMIVTTAVPPLEWAKLPEHLSQLQKLHISHLGLKYWIDVVPPDPGAFASLLTVLSTQSMDLPKCRLTMTMRDFPKADSAVLDLQSAVSDIAAAMAVLHKRGVEVIAQLNPLERGGCIWPLPARLAVMAPIIQDVFVPDAMVHQWGFAFCRPAHILALRSAGQLGRLCINSLPDDPRTPGYQITDACSIAGFTNLTSLQLGHCRVADLTELQHLRHLRELRLGFEPEYCGHSSLGVKRAKALSSCSQLQHVSLFAYAWSNATYKALSCLSSLSTLSISVEHLSRASAEIVGHLNVSGSVSVVLHKEISPKALKALTLGPAKIVCLELWYLSDQSCASLHTMAHLVALKLVRPSFSRQLRYQPSVSLLTLTEPAFALSNSVDAERLQLFMNGLPALRNLEVKTNLGRSRPFRRLYGRDSVWTQPTQFLEMPLGRLLNATCCDTV